MDWEVLVAWTRVRAEEVRRSLRSGYILKVELAGFKDGLDVEFEKRRGVKGDGDPAN